MANIFSGSPASSQQVPILSPQQMGVKSAASNQALKMLQGLGGGQFGQSPIAQNAQRNFQQNTVPGLAERFTSLGQGAQRSSAFQGALGQAGSELNQNLAGMDQQQMLQLLPLLLQSSLSPETHTFANEPQEGFGEKALSSIGSILPFLPTIIGSFFGPGGTAAGAAGSAGISGLMELFKNLFSKGQTNSSGQARASMQNQQQIPMLPNYNALISNVTGGR